MERHLEMLCMICENMQFWLDIDFILVFPLAKSGIFFYQFVFSFVFSFLLILLNSVFSIAFLLLMLLLLLFCYLFIHFINPFREICLRYSA